MFGIILFHLNFPLHASFLKNVAREEYTEELGNLVLDRKKQSIQFFRQQLSDRLNGKKKVSTTHLQHIAFFLTQIELGVFDYMILHLQLDTKISTNSNDPVIDLPEEDIRAALKTITSVLKGSLPVKWKGSI